MGRGQLKYRKRGGGGAPRGRGSGRGTGREGAAAATDPPSPRGKRRGTRQNHNIASLPSNTEKWGQSLHAGEAYNSSIGGTAYGKRGSAVGFAETVRLLDESEWAIGAGGGSAMHFSPLDDGQQLTAAETDGIGSVSLAVGELLSLDLNVLAACLKRAPAHRRLSLPPAYTVELEDEEVRDPALRPSISAANAEKDTGSSTAVTSLHQQQQRQRDQERQKTISPSNSTSNADAREDFSGLSAFLRLSADSVDGVSADRGTDVASSGYGVRTENTGDVQRGVDVVKKSEFTAESGVSGASVDARKHRSADDDEDGDGFARRPAGVQAQNDDVLDALLGMTVAESPPGQIGVGASVLGSGGNEDGSGVGRGVDDNGRVHLGDGGNNKGGGLPTVGKSQDGVDELEDWLDGMLAEDS